jgi:hypothetical protein
MKVHARSIGLLAVLAGCSSSHPLDGADGASEPGDALAEHTTEGADCGPPMELAPCRADSDCRSAYLMCVTPDYVTITVCRDPEQTDAGVFDPACPSFPELASAPTCPGTVDVTSTVCEARYKRPCTVDADCGPTGFTCTSGRCETKQPSITCSTEADCPAEWGCYAPCSCTATGPKVCEPPFIELHCPGCILP